MPPFNAIKIKLSISAMLITRVDPKYLRDTATGVGVIGLFMFVLESNEKKFSLIGSLSNAKNKAVLGLSLRFDYAI